MEGDKGEIEGKMKGETKSLDSALRMALTAAQTQPCLLCSGPPACVATWAQPHQGKTRLAFYSLCAKCFERPDKIEAVEATLIAKGVNE